MDRLVERTTCSFLRDVTPELTQESITTVEAIWLCGPKVGEDCETLVAAREVWQVVPSGVPDFDGPQ